MITQHMDRKHLGHHYFSIKILSDLMTEISWLKKSYLTLSLPDILLFMYKKKV